MKKCNGEQKFCGTINDFKHFVKVYKFRQIDAYFNGGENVYIDEHANMVRVYAPSSAMRTRGIEVWWRYIPYDNTTCITNAGYKLVSIGKKQYTMHQVVARTWLYNYDPSVYTDIDHIDGDKLNNDVSNLRWVTKNENMANYFAQKSAKLANGEVGLKQFVKTLKSQVPQRYTPEKKLVLNLKLAHPVKKKEDTVMDKKEKLIELYWNDDCSEEELEKEMQAIQDYLKLLKENKIDGEEENI